MYSQHTTDATVGASVDSSVINIVFVFLYGRKKWLALNRWSEMNWHYLRLDDGYT